ncbi:MULTISPECIES: TetR/AcrR family transcriptional regulator [unclassified Lacticaseibacillus]|uniref:TetR/AcrR family transcriptional regulator n=1 Tax=unclassified Lacticaseibacillus TaxID=2759744 RepID=UPI001940FD1C|nr:MULTISPECIES: TetR/AcrR family transcriptional regulator [unclassified Lacticaseibacillus]
MPKPTFFRLAEPKRKRLIKAAYDEFSRASFQDASISNIIKDAGIPRGSFYQYFEDKSDIFFYLLDRTRTQTEDLYKQVMQAHDGDLFGMAADFFDKAVEKLLKGPHREFYANVFLYMDFHNAAHFSSMPKKTAPAQPHKKVFLDYTLEHLDRSKLKVKSDEDVAMLFRQVMWVFMQSIGYYYSRRKNGENVTTTALKARMAKMLNWLQYGVAIAEEEVHD